MRLLISAGGTGGGVYPALSVAQTLIADGALPAAALLWVGAQGGLEADLVQRAGLPFAAIHAAGLHGVGPRLLGNAVQQARGLVEAVGLVRRFQPSVLFVTGGFVTAPVALAAWLQHVPVLMYLPDLEPGLALQFVARLARRIAVTAEESRHHFRGRPVVVTGYPTRPELAATGRDAARKHFDLDPNRATILVTGGSRGARSLNRAAGAALSDWLKDFQVIHVSGQLDWQEVEQTRAALPAELRAHYHVFPYLHEMGLALAAADLAVSRAGASALGEYPLFGLPAILVPYPFAWRYQKVNADYLAARGAAVRVNDEDLAARLTGEVRNLLMDRERLARMRAAAWAAATPEAARRLGQELLALGSVRP
jgi:UDP-N-acetylglucosamine--N-acetylmuramyl-(pentapeptide) pyrophosphoryl-undecaprenol N-acetylglucosamine transferase